MSVHISKDTYFAKLRAVTTARPSELKALLSNEFTSFPECLTTECHIHHGNKAHGIKF